LLLDDASSAEVAANALNLARRSFLRREQHEKFWKSIATCLNHAGANGFSVA
jgi:hypothetical protein